MSFRLIPRACFKARLIRPVSQLYFKPLLTKSFVTSSGHFNEYSRKVSDVIESEISLETSDEVKELPVELSNFLNKYRFSPVAKNGQNLAEIVKTTDKESVHIFFDVAQVANLPFDPVSVDQSMNNGEMEQDMDELSDNFANVNVVIVKKSDDSALSFELLMNLQEGSFYVDSVTPYEQSNLALNESAEKEVQRELRYHGPPFSNLDESLQESLEVYLESRGITEELTSFISGYSEFKENNEYIEWLRNMKKFFNP